MSELIGIGSFEDKTSNYGSVTVADFKEESFNIGAVIDTATFMNSATNFGALSGYGIFLDNTTNSSNLIGGPIVFTGSSVNTGTIREALFLDSSVNAGTITLSAVFANSSSNTGTVQGSAIFVNTSTNSGTVQNAQLTRTVTNTGTIAYSAVYVEPNDFFIDGYYNAQELEAPANWPIVVHQLNSFWFKYNSAGTTSLATGIYNDGTGLFNFRNGLRGTPETIYHNYLRLNYATNDNVLANGSSILYTGQHGTATVAANVSGIEDVDSNGDIDAWSTNGSGVVSWSPIIIHPYIQVGYYSNDETLVNGSSVLWSSYYSGATTVNNISGYAEFDGDTNNEIFRTNAVGIISWVTLTAHPFYHFGYYSNDSILSNGSSVLYNGWGTGAPRFRNSNGTADADRDGNLDSWSTSNNGTVTWAMISAHPYSNLGYYTDTQRLTSGTSVLYNAKGTGATVVANASSITIDIDGDGNTDTWTTNAQGIVSWSSTVVHPYSNIGYYSNTQNLVKGTTVLYTNQYSGAATVSSLTGIGDADKDGNDDTWSTNGSGVVTWAMISAYPFKYATRYYSVDETIVNGSSVLWNGQGTGATKAVSLTGIVDINSDNELDYWTTDINGVVSWVKADAYPYPHFGYFASVEMLENGVSVLYNSPTVQASPVANLSGTDDVNEDGNDDTWSTNGSGVITWAMISAHPYSNLGYYTDTENLIKGTTALYDSQGTGASVISNASGTYDIEGDGNDDAWSTNQNGIVTWYMLTAHPYSNLGYYTTNETLTSGISILYNGKGTGATVAANLSGTYDFELDGNTDEWFTYENGLLIWQAQVLHGNEITLGNVTYYYDEQGIINGTSVLYNSFGTSSVIVTNLSGIEDFTEDGNDDAWFVNENGILSWYTVSAYPFAYFGYYATDETLSNGTSILYNSFGTGATIAESVSGTYDVDGDGNADQWNTDGSGIITWAMVSAHPYSNLGYYTNTSQLTNGTTVLWNGQGTGATVAANLSGLLVDLDADGNTDTWTTDSSGIISWSNTIVHPFNNLGYYTNVQQVQTGTVLYSSSYDGATVVSNVSGTYDVEGDGNTDQWSTDSNGALSWFMLTAHQFKHFAYYSDDATLVNNSSILYINPGDGSPVAASKNSTQYHNDTGAQLIDLDGDGNVDEWYTNSAGKVFITKYVAHPFSHLTSYYSNDETLVSNYSVLYNDNGTAASTAANLSGIYDFESDGNNDEWYTTSEGVIYWNMIIVHLDVILLGENIYAYDGGGGNPAVNGTTVMYSSQGTGSTIVTNLSGENDITGEGDNESWSIDAFGILSWYTLSAHPYINLGYYYTDTQQLSNGATVLWNGFGTGASVVANLSGSVDIDLDGNADDWNTDENGIINWTMHTEYSSSITLNSVAYYFNGTLTSGSTTLWNSQGTGATVAANLSGTNDFDEDGHQDAWTTNGSGVITWTRGTAHPYAKLGYHADDQSLVNGSSVLYDSPYVEGNLAVNLSGTADVEGDGNTDEWSTNGSGVVSWFMLSSHPYSGFGGYYDVSPVPQESTIFDSPGSGASAITNGGTGTLDVDGDGNDDTWTVSQDPNNLGKLTWYMISAYPYSHLGYYSNSELLTSGVSKLYTSQGTGAAAAANLSGTGIDLTTPPDGLVDDWATSGDGTITWVASDTRSGPYSDYYYNNGLVNSTYNNDTPQQATDDSNWYTYSSGTAAAASGPYSNGYYASGVKSSTFNSSLPISAIDDQYFYVYTLGVQTLATGLYSNGAYDNTGTLDTTYNSVGVADQAQDNNKWYIYSAGIPTAIDGLYSYGKFDNGTKLTTYSSAGGTPEQASDNAKWYVYVSGQNPAAAIGAYSNGYYAAGEINSAYSNSTPQQATDDSNWYVYSAGVATAAIGAYSNGYYTTGGIKNTNYNNNTPQQTQDDLAYYTYYLGAAIAADGAYSNGYYSSGALDQGYSNDTPQQATDDSKWYTYITSSPTAAAGAYSNGYYTAGVKSTTYDNDVPQVPKDSSSYYVYADGNASLANGLYSFGALSGGIVNALYNSLNGTPEQAQDDNKWYVYNSGIGTLASGYYSTGHYTSGEIAAIQAGDVGPHIVLDDSRIYAFILNGNSSGFYTGLFENQWYHDGELVPDTMYFYNNLDTSWYNLSSWYTSNSHALTAKSPPFPGTTVYLDSNAFVNLDLDWIQPLAIITGPSTITFYSNNNYNVSCNITGTVILSGNATFNI